MEYPRSRLNKKVLPLRPRLGMLLGLSLLLSGSSPHDRSDDRVPEALAGEVAVSAVQQWRLDPEADAWVEATLESLTLRQRVGQLVVPWIRGGAIPRNSAEYRRIRRWIEEDEVGGLIVSRGPLEEFAPMMNALQSLARTPLLVVSDLETGPGMRLTGGTNLPPAMAFGAADSEALAFAAGQATAVEARAAGIHMTLGPVLDVNSNPLNPIINTRSFGEDPDRVGRLAASWIEGARAGGLLTAGKHFPGHGATELDSHVGLPTLTADLGVLGSLDLPPFRTAIAAGMEGVLVGHIAVPVIDGPSAGPASLSPGVIAGLLRDQLGFDGLVFTDALNMGGVTRHYSVPEASIQAILAGADVLLQPPGERAVIDAVVAAVESGRIPRSRIDEAAQRVLRAKAASGLYRPETVRSEGGRPPAEHAALAGLVARAAVTLVRDTENLVPLPPRASRILHVAYAGAGLQFDPAAFNAVLSAAGRNVDMARVDNRTTAATYRSLLVRANRADLVIVSANLVPREYRALSVEPALSAFVASLEDTGISVIAISLGSPYLLDAMPSVPTFLLGWAATATSQRAVAGALLGQTPIRGTLPISLPPHHRAGEGLRRSPG